MIGKVIWWLSLLGVAACACGAQIDRQARFDPQFALFVPEAFRGFSQVHIVRAAMMSEDSQAAQDQTVRLVRVRPIPAEHLSALALAASANGDAQMAIEALESAASRGWREPVSQMAVVEASLLESNYDQAAQRIIALWLVSSGKDGLNAYTKRLFETAEGRAAFARFLPSSERWRRNFVRQSKSDIDPEVVEQIFALAEANSEE